jgi:hypothetical protein
MRLYVQTQPAHPITQRCITALHESRPLRLRRDLLVSKPVLHVPLGVSIRHRPGSP